MRRVEEGWRRGRQRYERQRCPQFWWAWNGSNRLPLKHSTLRLGPFWLQWPEIPTEHFAWSFTKTWLWVKTNGTILGVFGAPPILVYVSGDWDVHWGYDLDFEPWPCEPQAKLLVSPREHGKFGWFHHASRKPDSGNRFRITYPLNRRQGIISSVDLINAGPNSRCPSIYAWGFIHPN